MVCMVLLVGDDGFCYNLNSEGCCIFTMRNEVHRMLKFRTVAWMLAIAGVVSLSGAAAWAADNNSIKIGVVDVQKVYKEAPRVKQYTEELDMFRQQLSNKLDIRSQNLMLTEDEIKELVDLKVKDNPTDKDKARIDELLNSERAKDNEFKTLQGTQNLNDQQKARLKELQDIQQKSKDTGNALAKDYEGQFQSKMSEMDDKARADLQDAIKKVADAKGMNLMVDKAVILIGGTDVTDDVIAKLDRKVQ